MPRVLSAKRVLRRSRMLFSWTALPHPQSGLWQRLHREFVTRNPCFLTTNYISITAFIYFVKTHNSNKVTSAHLLSDRAAKLVDVSHVPGWQPSINLQLGWEIRTLLYVTPQNCDKFDFSDKLRIWWDESIPFLCPIALRYSKDVHQKVLVVRLHPWPLRICSVTCPI